MRVSIIAAVSDNNVIGQDSGLPWRILADMQHFKRLTMGKPVIMGRKTFQTMNKPLFGRKNIILTRREDYTVPGCTVAHALEDALEAAEGADEVMIAGGEAVYRATLPFAHRMYLTLVHASFTGDTYFPEWNREEWREIEREDHAGTDAPYAYSFLTFERMSSEEGNYPIQ